MENSVSIDVDLDRLGDFERGIVEDDLAESVADLKTRIDSLSGYLVGVLGEKYVITVSCGPAPATEQEKNQ